MTDTLSAPTAEMHLARRVAPEDKWASLIINQVVDTDGSILGYIFVMNPDRPDAKWKFAGGHKKPGETPLETAMRENQGETGLRLPAEAYTELTDLLEWRNDHWSIQFLAKVPINDVRFINPHDDGNEGEKVHYFTIIELAIEIMHGTILPSHLRKFYQAVQIPV